MGTIFGLGDLRVAIHRAPVLRGGQVLLSYICLGKEERHVGILSGRGYLRDRSVRENNTLRCQLGVTLESRPLVRHWLGCPLGYLPSPSLPEVPCPGPEQLSLPCSHGCSPCHDSDPGVGGVGGITEGVPS